MHELAHPTGTDAWRLGVSVMACALGVGFSSQVMAAPATDVMAGPVLGAHTLLVQSDGKGSRVATSDPIDTQPSGSSLLALVGGFVSNAAAPSDSYGNHWEALGPAVTYHGYDGRFDAKAYVVRAAKGGPGHRVSVLKEGTAEGEITVPFIEIAHAGTLHDVAQNYPAPGRIDRYMNRLARAWDGADDSHIALRSGTVTTTGPATLVAVWWGDAPTLKMRAIPDNGFTIIEQLVDLPPNSAVQCVVAVKQVDAAGSYDVSWATSPAQGAILWLFAFQPSTAGSSP